MSKEYRYRKFIRWGQYWVPIYFGFFILVFWGVLGFAFPMIKRITGMAPSSSLFSTSMLIIPSVITCIFLLAECLTWYMYYRLAAVAVSLDENGVVYKYRGGGKYLSFETLRVESDSIRYTGGWLKLTSGKGVLRLMVTMEGIGNFVQELKVALDGRGLSSHYDSQKLFSFMKTAAYADQSWDRASAAYGKLYLIIPVIAVTIANGYILGTSGWAGLFGAIGWGVLSMLWATGAYLIAEAKLGRKIAKESSGPSFTFPQRDLAYERYVFNEAVKWGGWLYFGISLLVFVGILAIKLLLFVPR